MSNLLCIIQERAFNCGYGDNKQVKALINELNDHNVGIEDILLHDGSYYKVHPDLAQAYPGARDAKKD